MARLFYQGHGSYRIISAKGLVIYIDPYAGEGYQIPADFVLVTHEHPDHNKVDLVKKNDNCLIFHAKNFMSGGKYGEARFNGIRIRAVPAYNENHAQNECVGFVITLENEIKIYCSGDTSYTTFMEEELQFMNIDYALLPCDGVYNMDAKEAARCANIIGAAHSIPIHTKPGALFSPQVAEQFAKEIDEKRTDYIILKPNDEINLLKRE
ncbi:MAG: MBL fold metallo-hydrolase [Treponema sp.]|nr:MBL fold metallo-hydrolase [Treponema sp.]